MQQGPLDNSNWAGQLGYLVRVVPGHEGTALLGRSAHNPWSKGYTRLQLSPSGLAGALPSEKLPSLPPPPLVPKGPT